MRILDQIFKNAIVQVAQSCSRSDLEKIAQAHQARFDYTIRVLTAPDLALQRAVRDAAIADTGEFPEQLAAILTVWLSPAFRVVSTRLDVPTFFPAGSLGQPVGTVIVEDTTDFPPAGTFLVNTSQFYEQVIGYTGKTPTSFTGCTGGGGSAGQGNVITARIAGLDTSASAAQTRKDLFIAAFTRRSENTIGALNFINDKHVWSWNEIEPPVETRIQVPAF